MNGIKDLFKPGKLVTAPGIFDGISASYRRPFQVRTTLYDGLWNSRIAFRYARCRDR